MDQSAQEQKEVSKFLEEGKDAVKPDTAKMGEALKAMNIPIEAKDLEPTGEQNPQIGENLEDKTKDWLNREQGRPGIEPSGNFLKVWIRKLYKKKGEQNLEKAA
ncbi:MAG: hypothetical protein V1808_04300 [Candidatus Daviesbacteria bacterium]